MKSILLFLLVAASTQATEWKSIRPLVRTNVEKMKRLDVTSRITGGNVATPGQFPFVAALIIDDIGICGGSLISDTIVLTAGHVLDGATKVEVNLGAHYLFDYDEPGRVTMVTRDINVHENYNIYDLLSNIGFVRLEEPVILSPTIELVRLPSRSQGESETFEGVLGTAMGWGVYNTSYPELSSVLRYAEMNIISNAECDSYFPGGFVADTHLCTIEVTGNTCYNDAGGPLTVKESDDISTLVGLTSFGTGSLCEVLEPSGFTRVSSFLDWIENNTGVVIRP